MSNFYWKKNTIQDCIKDGLIITTTTSEIFFALKAGNLKLLKAFLDAMDTMKHVSGICGEVLVKDYAVYKKWINK